MSTETKINISSIVGIREAIEQIFSLMFRHLESYAADTEDIRQIEECHYYAHQLNGMLEMLGLNGVLFVSQSVEDLLRSIHEQRIDSKPEILALVKQAGRTIYRYLDALVDGEKDNPAKLFPIYRKIMHAQGLEEVAESDLFFPDMREELPLQPAQFDLDAQSRQSTTRQARAQFQTGLLNWLKDTRNKQSLRQMIDAVHLIERLPASIEQRTFWWVSSGFLDSLLYQEQDIDKSTRRLCGKIEQEIRYLNKETHVVASRLTRELLYRIARSEPVGERVQEISRVYDWETLLSSFDNLGEIIEVIEDEDTVNPKLQAMQALLVDANDQWRKVSAGEQGGLVDLLTTTDQLKVFAAEVNCPPLEKLISVMHGAISYVRIRPQSMSEGMSLDIASSLLLTDNAIENFYQLSPEFPSQVEALATRIRAITTGKGSDAVLPDLPGLDQAGHHVQEKKLLKQVANEVLASLVQIEDILDRFFFEPTVRNDLPTLPSLFKQIAGVLTMLELERANTLLDLCYGLVEKLMDPDSQINPVEQTLLADALSSLGFFIEALRNSQPNREEIVEAAIDLFNQDLVEKSPPSETPEILAEARSPSLQSSLEDSDEAADSELLTIFLEESDDVLVSIAENLEACRHDPADVDALTAIRRGFHTLKGSGRMVKLQDLSEVAWRIEQLMNRWLSERKSATDTLLDLLGDSQKKFSDWCASLRKTGAVEIEATRLLDQVKSLMYGADEQSAPVIDAYSSEQVIQPAAPIEIEATVMIGEIEVPGDLFEIFSKEASTHIDTLKRELTNLEEDSATPVSHESMLAAHTLTSISRTLKLNFIAETGQILERWLTQLRRTSGRPDAQTLPLMTTAINLLCAMVESACHQQLPTDEILQSSSEVARELAYLMEQPKQLAGTDTDNRQAESTPTLLPELGNNLPVSTPQTSISDSVEADQELLEVFLEEAQELQPEIGTNLRAWRNQPDQAAARKALLRALHTLKGSARIAGVPKLGEQAHEMENAIETMRDNVASPALLDQLEIQFDAVSDAVEQLRLSLHTKSQIDQESAEDKATVPPLPAGADFALGLSLAEVSEEPEKTVRKAILRVNAGLIDCLVNDSGEASIIRSQVEARLYDFGQYLQDLGESVDRMRGQLREIELLADTRIPAGSLPQAEDQSIFDPLELDRFTRFQELTRLMAESMDDVVTIHKSLREIQRAADTAVNQQARLNRQLQQDLVRIRTAPFKQFSERLYRVVRQVARDADKQANLIIQGDEIEIDRSVLDKINSPLEHLLRNALVHGIETPEERRKAGKTETGQLTLDLHQEGNEIVITLHDDGIGLDIERIREKASKIGLLSQDDRLNDEQLIQIIFTHGFTTLDEVTDIAGRGVGLDIVKNELSEIGGRITATSERNRGVTFTLHLPMTLAVTQTLMVKIADSTYAIPMSIVAHVLEMDTEKLRMAYQNRVINWNDEQFPLVYLPHLLGETSQIPEVKRHNRVLLLQTGQQRLAVHADVLIGQCEVVVKNTGPQLARAPGVEGATITGDGGIVLIINPLKLMQREQAKELLSPSSAAPFDLTAPQPSSTSPVIMIVDDSLTVRKVTSRLLERQGYEILIAKDGVGALQLLRETTPAIMLVDIEMPHMDGFELIRTIRNNPETHGIPIIIISSRTADKHRKVADELGVNEFMGKPYQEDELLGHIERLIKK